MKKITAKKNSKLSPYVTEKTFEKHMGSVARSFATVEDRFRKVEDRLDRHESIFERMLGQMELMREDSRHIRQDIQAFVHDVSRHDRLIGDLADRVEKLEKKQAP